MPVAFLVVLLVACSSQESSTQSERELGEQLFFDQNLSFERTQSCATCHDPEAAFVDSRMTNGGRVLGGSIGADGTSVGDRNAPSAMYAQFVPALSWMKRRRFNTDGDISVYDGAVGGLFYDGRAQDLSEQAGSPPLNPIEMGMPSVHAVVRRLRENRDYEEGLTALYGSDVFQDEETAYARMTDAIAAFERSEAFAPFDSRYDRSLLSSDDEDRYIYAPGTPAALGKALFFSTEFTNCAACHQLHPLGGAGSDQELFTGHEYHNLGVPVNVELRSMSGENEDGGLGAVLDDDEEFGKFRTPTLRNVAVTPPYMHNGVFRELATVIRFYEHAKRRARGTGDESVNPETGESWDEPEIEANISVAELSNGNKDLSSDENALALTCFLLTLTDARYEPLIDPERLLACGI